MPVYESRILLPGPGERLFDFITRPANLQLISPPEVQMVFIEAPEVIGLGSRLVFKIQVYGQVQQFEHKIVEFESPHRFREQAVSTPMKSWIQDYILEPGENGLVVLVNRIEFEPPGGLLGFILTPERILANLEEGYAHRRARVAKGVSMTEPAGVELDIWRRLEQVLIKRMQTSPAGSYVAELLDGGHPVLAGKVIEEAYEVIEACAEADRAAMIHEAADLVFHLLVLLRTHGVGWSAVEAELAGRFGLGGLAEKASRSERPS